MSTTRVEDIGAVGAPPKAAGGEPRAQWLAPPIAWYAVCMISLVTLCGQLDFGLMSLLVQPIKQSTHMTDSQIGLLMGTAYGLGYACCGVPLARISDRRRRTFVLTGAMTIWSIGTAACGLMMSFWPFAICRGIMGGSISVKGPTTVSILPDLVPRDKLARAFGIYNICLIGGQSLSMIAGGLLLGVFARHMPVHLLGFEIKHAWQMVFVAMGLPGLVVAAIVVATVPEPKRHGAKRQSAPISEVARFIFAGPAARVFVPLIIGATLAGILLAGYGGWRAAFFARTYHMGAHVYGPISGTLSLVTAPIGVMIGSFVAERMHRRWPDSHLRLALIIQILTMPFYILSTLMPTATLALACQFVMGILMMVSAPSVLAAMQIITPNEMRAQVNAVYMITISVIGNIFGAPVVAFMTDYLFRDPSQLRYAMMTMALVCTPVGLICSWLAVKPYGRLYQQVRDAEAAAT